MFTLSKPSVLLVAFAVAAHAATKIGPTPNAGTVFSVYPGWDMDNGAVSVLPGGTEQACLKACSLSTACVAYAYGPYSFNLIINGNPPACILKNSIDMTTFKTQPFDVTMGVIGSCGTISPVGFSRCINVPA
ncbi:hypothetical protein B0H19DRAFT_1260319 [Mycena capillaripes]|nr:hypothetical protein B0H19DRAFT_1260319 [Mycena capillaripes]